MATLEQKLWFCGFYEGEGSVSNDKSNNNRIKLSITQNDPTPLNLAKELWGGNVRKRVRKSPASDKLCVGYEWTLSHNYALKFLKDITPYMMIPYKIKQMNSAFEIAEKGDDRRYKCNFCDIDYANPSGRRRHEKKEHIDKGVLFECDECKNTYKSKDSLNRHIKNNHR